MPGGRVPGPVGLAETGRLFDLGGTSPRSGGRVGSNLSVGLAPSIFESRSTRTSGTSLLGATQQLNHLSLHSDLLAQPLDFERLYEHIKQWEGEIGWMYLDTHNPQLVTVGAGNMLPSVQAAQKLPFRNTRTGQPASPEEIAGAFHAVLAMRGPHHAAKYYLQKPSIEISSETIKELAIKRAKRDFIPKIKRLYPRFDEFPIPAREAIFDVAYNSGVGRPESVSSKGEVTKKATGLFKFTHLKAAIDAGDWMAAARASHRKSSRPERNRFVYDLFEQAAQVEARENGPRHHLHVLGQHLRAPGR